MIAVCRCWLRHAEGGGNKDCKEEEERGAELEKFHHHNSVVVCNSRYDRIRRKERKLKEGTKAVAVSERE